MKCAPEIFKDMVERIEEKGEMAQNFAEEFAGETVCQACGTDIREIYGDLAPKMMSIHTLITLLTCISNVSNQYVIGCLIRLLCVY